MQTPQEYYQHDGPMTALAAHADEFRALPRDLAPLCEVVQGVLIHRDIAPWLYGLTLTEAQRDDGHSGQWRRCCRGFTRSTRGRSPMRAMSVIACPAYAAISR